MNTLIIKVASKIAYVSTINLSANVKYPTGGIWLLIEIWNITVATKLEPAIPNLVVILSGSKIKLNKTTSIIKNTGKKVFIKEFKAILEIEIVNIYLL